jgi:hypothetical protein
MLRRALRRFLFIFFRILLPTQDDVKKTYSCVLSAMSLYFAYAYAYDYD